MEGIITLIIIIIAFNILNFLARSLRGGRQVEQQRAPVETDRLSPNESLRLRKDYDTYFRSESLDDTETDHNARVKTGIGLSETVKSLDKDTAKQTSQRTEQVISRKAGQPSSIPKNLQQVLNQKESLVAAFIFHEIIDPPVALRRKR